MKLTFQIDRGACIFATTRSDNEIPADKSEYHYDDHSIDSTDANVSDDVDVESSDRARRCATFLRNVTQEFGNGDVFALYDYASVRDDELSFVSGDRLTIIRRGDDQVLGPNLKTAAAAKMLRAYSGGPGGENVISSRSL